ncbi:hypothetical protein [Neptunomonas sp. XY-337]|uniref:hypothetical protein n=1 Tax=Neptunomonas sp. XY-337 TaxID=2561897 RepID=UPI0010AAB73C|nr:hypothetical protein [Neptunomonas sp. XY-337]
MSKKQQTQEKLLPLSSDALYAIERAILVESPLVTPAEYARRSGRTLSSVRNRIATGDLPVFREHPSSAPMVNMMLIAKRALEAE